MSKNTILPHSGVDTTSRNDDIKWMTMALDLAKRAEELGEVPIGAVLVRDNQIIGKGYNQPITNRDPTAHAEIVALRAGGLSLHNYRLLNTTLYVTLEPCLMCIGAMVHARIQRLVFGAFDPKSGAAGTFFDFTQDKKLNHQFEVCGGILSEACGSILKNFFLIRR
jgi:tRNA(adenine34) deaminase